jgi:hypothetical protein
VTKRLAAALLLALVVAVPARADFNAVAKAIGAKHGMKRVWIPFLGLARLAVWVASPSGVHDFQLATFEGGRGVDPTDLRDLLRTHAGKGFSPLVQVWSRRSNEWSFIYARPGKRANRLELLVLAKDGDDTTLVRVDVDAKVLAKHLDQPRHVHTNVVAHVGEH